MIKNRSALLLMDLQFGPLWGTINKEEVICTIKKLIEKAKLENVPIIYTQHEELTGGILIRNSPFWQLEESLVPGHDIIIPKLATDAFYQTKLNEILADLGVTHLVIAGARTEYCVDTTCRVAISLGYDVILVEDGHTTVDGILPAKRIIDHHNYHLSTVGTPERKIKVMKESDIGFYKE
ncbi:cysteine hydrolase family protein [Bacillus sp. FJAT-49736]|uniref:cysteine hydrolase family protein n=1 Tax=Bacillus sp. FJAT-49736 TaxID=2833582 RepID=UPI001BCA3BD6|nr:cysteine hydrolase family protein [Bacillus sp. FJAT-49736]MBS4172239.1 cysteine hydrolase [Bacillus sp. FJAT-49736]